MREGALCLRNRFRFDLRTLFWIHILLIPICMVPVYYRLGDGPDSRATLFALLIAPIFYSAAFSLRKALRLLHRPAPNNSLVYPTIGTGAAYAVLFGVLALGPIGVLEVCNIVAAQPTAKPLPEILSDWVAICFVAAAAVVHYAVIGGATGGVLGLACGYIHLRRVRASNSQVASTEA